MNLFKAFCFVVCLSPGFAAAQHSISIDNAYIPELPPNAETAAVYMAISNTGQHAVNLTEVQSDAAQSAMIHLSSMQGGMMVMEHLVSLEVGPGERVVFEPGGFHIMLSGLRRALVAGDVVNLNFRFSNGLVLSSAVPIVNNN